jgi:hypothetical protein
MDPIAQARKRGRPGRALGNNLSSGIYRRNLLQV